MVLAGDHFINPRQRILLHFVDTLHAQTNQATIHDVLDVLFQVICSQPMKVRLTCEHIVDEVDLHLSHQLCSCIDLSLGRIRPPRGILLNDSAEQVREAFNVLLLVQDRPCNDLTHTLHQPVTRVVQQHHER